MTLLDPILRSPRLPQYVQELQQVLEAEREKRQRFFDEVREDQKAEFINGEMIVHSPVRREHSDVSLNLAKLLSIYVDKHRLGWVAHEKTLISLTRNDYEPDVCYFNAAKAAQFKPGQMKFPSPDLIIEILSPSTEQIDRVTKFEDYALHGTDEYWIVDPDERTVEQYLLRDGQYELALKVNDGLLASRAVRGFELPVRAAFDAQENLKAVAQIVSA